MRKAIVIAAAAALLSSCAGVGPGDTHGYCGEAGTYRCLDNQVEVCSSGEKPGDAYKWVVLQDCSVPKTAGPGSTPSYGACVVGNDGIARCVY